MKTLEEKLEKLNRKANEIYESEFFTWEEKYDQIFSEKISRKVFKMIRLDYYDPDTSYQDDVQAFMIAFNERLNK
jgi:hypothetical protein